MPLVFAEIRFVPSGFEWPVWNARMHPGEARSCEGERFVVAWRTRLLRQDRAPILFVSITVGDRFISGDEAPPPPSPAALLLKLAQKCVSVGCLV